MTEEKKIDISKKPDIKTDYVLALIISMANRGDIKSIGVTLAVKGLVVSGDLIGGKDFFEGIALDIGASSPFFIGLGEGGAEGYKTFLSEKNDVDSIEFIHLKNARIMSGEQAIPGFDQDGTYWRGRLQSVDGFFFGTPNES